VRPLQVMDGVVRVRAAPMRWRARACSAAAWRREKRRKQTPGRTRPARPRRCSAAARDTQVSCSRAMPRPASYLGGPRSRLRARQHWLRREAGRGCSAAAKRMPNLGAADTRPCAPRCCARVAMMPSELCARAHRISLTRPKSMTQVTSSMVMDVSATLVASTTLRVPASTRSNTLACAAPARVRAKSEPRRRRDQAQWCHSPAQLAAHGHARARARGQVPCGGRFPGAACCAMSCARWAADGRACCAGGSAPCSGRMRSRWSPAARRSAGEPDSCRAARPISGAPGRNTRTAPPPPGVPGCAPARARASGTGSHPRQRPPRATCAACACCPPRAAVRMAGPPPRRCQPRAAALQDRPCRRCRSQCCVRLLQPGAGARLQRRVGVAPVVVRHDARD